jgi:acetyl esterase/lipase
VPCEVVEVPGAFHAFDALFPRAGVVRDFRAREVAALRAALIG